MTCALDVDRLFFSYENFKLQDINMQLHQGEQKAMVGLNGSGKTTLFKLMLGLLEPLSGDTHVFERRVTNESLWEIRQDIGFLFQNPDDQLFAPTVWEDIAFGPRNQGLSEHEVEERVREALDIVKMSGYADRPVNQMSHGQAKRVALAGIVAMRPRILFLDEPTIGLDPQSRRVVWDFLKKLNFTSFSVLSTGGSQQSSD